MAITDNQFTAAEVQASVAANPALLTELKTGLQPLGHHAITKDEHGTFIETERNKIRGEETSTIYGGIDKDVLEVTGIAKKGAEEKTYDYLKRVLGANKESQTTLQTEVANLKKQIADGSTDQSVKDALTQAQADLKKLQDEEIPAYKTKLFEKDVRREAALGLRGLKLKPGLPESLTKIAIENAEAQLVASAKTDANGGIYFVGKDGNTILEGTTPAKAEFVLKTMLADILDTGKQQAGAGTGAPGAGGANTGVKNKDGADIVVPDTIKTKVELQAFLGAQGLDVNSKDFITLFEEHGKGLKLR